ncbi:MAG: carboxypeptidase regulatory-like domain-containing protein [Deltaproteobacteria bacterium]|nr:carboxypeptidase regulatory-like domain-containing protein [Deltaproteobacteria bacterium]MBI3293917.1 carboxypeptidase regulatory-like domain-containing protein [Deltaproteobacteria bacterium]
MKATLMVTTLLGASFALAGNVTGKVSFKGTAPKADVVKMNADPVCAKENAGKKVVKDDVVVNANGTLANVFVYVKEGLKKEAIPADVGSPVTFDQSGCMYTPHVLGVRVGQKLKIVNSDSTMHNVHSLSKTNPSFNSAMPTKGQTIEKDFKKAEFPVKVKCDVHGWMAGYIGVMEHPFFAVSDSSGAFSINNLPPGDYKLEAWHEKFGTKMADVKVTAAGAGPVEFTFN